MAEHTVAPIPGPRILIVRHGKTKLNPKKGTLFDVVRGQMEIPLTAEGKREAIEDAKLLAGTGIAELYSSPLSRAVWTAQKIGEPYHLKPRIVRQLLPWDMGDLTGTSARLAKPILRRFAEEEPKQRVPGGESFHQWEVRLVEFIRKLMKHVEQKGCTVCCVSHSRCIKLLESWVGSGIGNLRFDVDILFRDDTEPGDIYELRPEKGRWTDHRISRDYRGEHEERG